MSGLLGDFERMQTARCDHVCNGCRNTIAKGSQYWVVIHLPRTYYWREPDGSYDRDEQEFSHLKYCDSCFKRSYGYDGP